MYDLTIIGAGWAGFNAALRAKELGLEVCLIDSHQIGGTCLNYGCIPTKTLINCAKLFSLAKKSSSFGIETDNLRVNLDIIQEKKDKVILQLKQGMQSRLSGIDFINSRAQIISSQEVKIDGRIISSKSILIATGSQPLELAKLKFDRKKIISSDEALAHFEIPRSLLIVGGGVIGCEFASLYSIFGAEVTIVEKMPQLLPAEDGEIAKKLEVVFKKKGINVVTGADISTMDLEPYSKILVCVGRVPNIMGLGLENLGVELEHNQIMVDEYLQSSQGHIYAAGDCTARMMLAHYAAYQGVTAAENIFSSRSQKADNLIVPSCIFTEPQIASVGLKQEDALRAGLKINVHRLDFRASAMARIVDEVDGFIKIVANEENDRIVGASIIGPQATELISTLVVAISAGLTIKQIRGMIFAHPTFSESLHEALHRPQAQA